MKKVDVVAGKAFMSNDPKDKSVFDLLKEVEEDRQIRELTKDILADIEEDLARAYGVPRYIVTQVLDKLYEERHQTTKKIETTSPVNNTDGGVNQTK